jgi:hypothetical protein
MADTRLEKGVKRVTVLAARKSPVSPPVSPPGSDAVVVRARKKRKRQSKGLRGLEKLARRSAAATTRYADTYLARHQRSNRRKRDGWLRDLGVNLLRAQRSAWKKLGVGKLFGR